MIMSQISQGKCLPGPQLSGARGAKSILPSLKFSELLFILLYFAPPQTYVCSPRFYLTTVCFVVAALKSTRVYDFFNTAKIVWN